MEPRRDDGDDLIRRRFVSSESRQPQWSPVVTTGTTIPSAGLVARVNEPQWSPVVTTGTTHIPAWHLAIAESGPQWSPVVTTGTTPRSCDSSPGC